MKIDAFRSYSAAILNKSVLLKRNPLLYAIAKANVEKAATSENELIRKELNQMAPMLRSCEIHI